MKVQKMFSRMRQKLNDAVWWVRHRTTHRYNVLKIKSLEPRYYDKDDIMLHACFQILVNFVENEKPFEWWGKGDGKEEDAELQAVIDDHDRALREIEDLYIWWKEIRINRPEFDAIEDKQEYNRMTQGWAEEDQKNLERLAKVREYLWT